MLDVAGAQVAVDGEVGEAGGGHVARAGLVMRKAVLIDVTPTVDLTALEARPLLRRAATLRAVQQGSTAAWHTSWQTRR